MLPAKGPHLSSNMVFAMSEAERMGSRSEEYGSIPGGVSMIPLPDQPQWYAIRTRSRHEKMVSEQLQQQGIETFLPLIKRTHKWSDRVKQVELPLFAGYNFVRVVLSSPDRLRVLQAHGVAGFVGIHGSGTAIPESQIQDIRTLLASKVPFAECSLSSSLMVGQRVRIRGGSLDGVEGILAAHNGDQSLMISIEPIQRSLCIRVQGYTVESA
jgi:transcription antitermination factor NusG